MAFHEIIFLAILLCGTSLAADTSLTIVSSISPREGSPEGATRITIHGTGFAKNQFNFGEDAHVGNHVELVSRTRVYTCDIHKDGCTEVQLMCYTRSMPEDTYHIQVFVDGDQVQGDNLCGGDGNDRCAFTSKSKRAPLIRQMATQGGLPGELLKMEGRLYTDRYETNKAEGSNGAVERILRVYLGGQTCELRVPNTDEYYGLSLYSKNEGEMSCKPQGSYVGNQNFSFLVDGPYGRSMPELDVLWISAQDQITMYQTFAEVTGVSPSSGSILGGTLLTISGRYFDETDAPLRVTIDDRDCLVNSVLDDTIICEVEARPNRTIMHHPGNRGLIVSVWNSTEEFTLELSDIQSVNTTPITTEYLDAFSWSESDSDHDQDRFLALADGYFIPPSDNLYRFFIHGDDEAELWFSNDTEGHDDMVLIGESRSASWKYDKFLSQKSDIYELAGGKPYRIRALLREYSRDAHVSVAVHMYHTQYTGQQAGSARNERQILASTSSVTLETQSIAISSWTSQSSVEEVQDIRINSPSLPDTVFRIGLYGVYTGPLNGQAPANTIKSELNLLPLDLSVNVVVTDQGLTRIIKITFTGQRGDWPDMTVIQDPSSGVNMTYSVSQVQQGVPSMRHLVLSFDGLPGAPMYKTDITEANIKSSLDEVFSVRCTSTMNSPMSAVHHNTFESVNSYWTNGVRVSNVEPFCGRYSLLNPTFIYCWYEGQREIDITQKRLLCFAYKGSLENYLVVNYYTTSSVWRRLDVELPTSASWEYICVDFTSLLQEQRGVSHTSVLLRGVYITRIGMDDVLIDDVYIGSVEPSDDPFYATYRRLKPREWLARDVTVRETAVDTYDVTFNTYKCASDLPLIAVEHARGLGDAEQMTYSSGTWPSGVQVQVTRQQAASPPIHGSFSISHRGRTLIGIPADVEADKLQNLLETLPMTGKVEVVRTGTCSGYEWSVEWRTHAGDHPVIVLNATDIIGTNASMMVTTEQDGGVFFDPIPGDMLRTTHNEPQVSVVVNKIPSVCTGDCGYNWNSSATPVLYDVTPTRGSGSDGVTLTISGEGFDNTTLSNNLITIGGTPCLVSGSSGDDLLCTLGAGPAGTHDVIMTVLGSGLARHNDTNVYFTYTFDVSGFEPVTGGLGGGVAITINGTGFGPCINVTVDSQDCPVIASDYDYITCIVPQGVSAGAVDVMVFEGSNTVNVTTQFTYDSSLTPSISSISDTVISVLGGTIVIEGNNFGEAGIAVVMNEHSMNVTHHNDTFIMLDLGSESPGTYPLYVHIQDRGYAVNGTNDLPLMTYKLAVTSLEPGYGSHRGGTKVTVTGEGFGEDLDTVEVTVGQYLCVPTYVQDTQIQCTMSPSAHNHVVTNQGVHPVYETGYAWEPQTLDIQVGDTVTWAWSTPNLLPGITYRVEQTESATSMQYKGSGFKSHPQGTANGGYQYQFTSEGMYYYWSGGPVDEAGYITMRGVINVIPKPSTRAELSVRIGGHEAPHRPTALNRRKKRDVGCSAVTPFCPDPLAPNGDNVIEFDFVSCATPTVTSISPTSGSADVTITINGTGFGSENCQNDVQIGGYTCTTVYSSESSIQCQLDTENTTAVGSAYDVTVEVGALGLALSDIKTDTDRQFVLLPHVVSVSPSAGSVAGGTELSISGGGFVDGTTSVMVDGVLCQPIAVTYNKIKCITGSAWETTADVSVGVQVHGQRLQALCTDNCTFSYSTDNTPTVHTIEPVTLFASNETVTLIGTGFSILETDITVYIGDVECEVISTNDTVITCNAGRQTAGQQQVAVTVHPSGYADMDADTITVLPGTPAVSPSSGSLGGGTVLTVNGFGFANDTTVTISGNDCPVTQRSALEVECTSPAGSSGSADLVVTSNGVAHPTVQYTYSTTYTAELTALSIGSGSPGDTLTISATNMLADAGLVMVTVGGVSCTISSISTTSLDCTLGEHSAGVVDVLVYIQGWGFSTGSLSFTYVIGIDSVSPSTGSYGGGQPITLIGDGFSADMNVTICGELCSLNETTSSTEVTCFTPEHAGSGDTSCDIVVMADSLTDTLSGGYTYSDTLTPTISDVSPRRGGTGGGTSITISGSGFGSDVNGVTVSIAGTRCPIDSVSDSEITCTTDQHKPSVIADVIVQVGANGNAKQTSAEAATFQYIDVWSSRFTWGGLEPPIEGDFVVIPADMTVLLDIVTPVLKMLLIKGGQVIFDEVDIELNAEIILITEGGLLQVGTEDAPFQHNAQIILHGHPKSKELPIYGTKCIAVREGMLDLHGKPVGITWTHLASTVNPGDTSITLVSPVEWSVADEIVIATTGDRHTQAQNEQRTITAVSEDGLTLTLDEGLEFEHLGEEISLTGGQSLQARAEVGLLTHNVVVRGSDDDQWHDEIEPCEAGFDTGEFATQTCFQGRFGEDIGSNQFGAQIIMHAPVYDEELVVGRIENVELTYVGQAFRLGRYAIHFHLNGYMPSSYVRGCSIHKSFNRAVNIHATHLVTIEHNVAFDIMGGAFFMEDGVETGNVFQYNLAVMVISSTSLQNDDITPAAFWVTNANNTLRHNAAAGGSHFGFWYRMHSSPDGPSFDRDICPQKVPLGEFVNNTVHSHGWFGIWIFEHFYPMEGGGCDSNTPVPAKFYSLTAWNNEKGAEWVGGGAIQFIDFLLVHNSVAGLEMKLIANIDGLEYKDDGPMVKDNLIVASGGSLSYSPTTHGIILPYARGLSIRDTTFSEFSSQNQACFAVATITGTTEDNNGGFMYKTRGLIFDNASSKIFWRWQHEAVFVDEDGTLCGTADCRVVPHNPSLPPQCSIASQSYGVDTQVPGSICDGSVNFHRFSFNNAIPQSLMHKNVTFSSSYGSTFSFYKMKRVTHKLGWMVLLHGEDTWEMSWDNAEHLTNISYLGTISDFKDDEYIILSHNLTQSPDMFSILPGDKRNGSESLTADSYTGDWSFDSDNTVISYMISSKSASAPNGTSEPTHYNLDLDVLRCYYKDCIPPPDPSTLPPSTTRPDYATYWDETASWTSAEVGWGGNYGGDSYGPPLAGDDVKIPEDKWIVVRGPTAVLDTIWIYGGLEFDGEPDSDGEYYDLTFSATHIIIAGGRLVVGWGEDKPFLGTMSIILNGNHFTPDVNLPNGPNVGSKALGVFGGLDLHGVLRNVTWTRLAQTADIGATSLVLVEAVDWSVGEEIVIAPTGFDLEETEIRTVSGVTNNRMTISWTEPLLHKHYVSEETIGPSSTYTMAAEVGLLSHNIKIIGADYPQLQEQAFGARVLVGTFATDEVEYKGNARLSNVEFYHSGQEGWTDWYDPRYSLAFLNTGDSTELRPSYVRSCAFHDGFAPALGLFGANQLDVSDNVIHHTVGSAMIVMGEANRLIDNLVVKVVHPGVFNGRNELRPEWDGGIQALGAVDVVLQGNAVAGSHRALYRVDGESCSKLGRAGADMWTDNVGHSALSGVTLFKEDGVMPCTLLANFTIYRTFDFGVYVQSEASVKVVNYLSLDNQLGLYPMVIRPSATGHDFEDKFFEVQQSSFVGRTSIYDCSDTLSGTNIDLSETGRSWSSAGGGKVGIAWATFSSGSNNAPSKPFVNVMAYQALNGILRLQDVTFTSFTSQCGGSESDVAITTNPNNDDAQHPVEVQDITLHRVHDDNRVYIHRANLGKINPSDCVDMECDGLKKALLNDLDGTFLGQPGTVLPQSEWAWDGDKRRGLGDYRIPISFLTDAQGNRIPVDDIVQERGIIRDDTCQYKEAYQAYVCHGLDYQMLHLENMDSDTETRRVSPVSVYSEGFIDLINGPQDHGWCFGYTCQKRLSTFPIILATNKTYEIYYTGTTPQNTRYHWLNTDDTQAVVLATWYAQSWRLNVFVGDQYIMPKNGYYTEDDQLAVNAPDYDGQYLPNPTDPTGTNYFDRATQMLYVLVRGSTPVDVKTDETVLVTFNVPFMTVDDFFGERIVENLAAFFDIPADKIRYAEAVRESRRKRSDTFTFTIEIANTPSSVNVTDPNALSGDEIRAISSTLVTAFQLGELGDMLNITVTSMSIIAPPPASDSPEWGLYTVSGVSSEVTLVVPEALVLTEAPLAGTEGNAFNVMPALQMEDVLGGIVNQLGSLTDLWMISVTMEMMSSSSPEAVLSGTTEVPLYNAWANYTDLSISHSGEYRLLFNITSPAEASVFNVITHTVTIEARQLSGEFSQLPDALIVGEQFDASVALTDADTQIVVQDIGWKNNTWSCEAFLFMPDIYQGELSGSVQITLDADNNSTFNSLFINAPGLYIISVQCLSSPAEYNFTFSSAAIMVYPQYWQGVSVDLVSSVQLSFDADYNTVAAGEEDHVAAAIHNHLWNIYPNVTFTQFNLSQGSIVAVFFVSGESDEVRSTLTGLFQRVTEGMIITYGSYQLTALPYMLVDGENFYENDELVSNGLSVPVIVGITVGVTVFLGVVIGFFIWYFLFKKPNGDVNVKSQKFGKRNTVFVSSDEDDFSIHMCIKGTGTPSRSTSRNTTSSDSISGSSTDHLMSSAPVNTSFPQIHKHHQPTNSYLSSLDEPSSIIPAAPLEQLLYTQRVKPPTHQPIPVQPADVAQYQDTPELSTIQPSKRGPLPQLHNINQLAKLKQLYKQSSPYQSKKYPF